MTETYNIKLPAFEGPFDLLLFFIERDELDINNIPIAKITDDFLSYLRQAQSMNIDLASEFIVVAATLMCIKAKLLLPRKQVDEAGNEIDPRAELVDRLLEYKRYKSVLEEMRRLEEMRAFMNPRGNALTEVRRLAERALAGGMRLPHRIGALRLADRQQRDTLHGTFGQSASVADALSELS